MSLRAVDLLSLFEQEPGASLGLREIIRGLHLRSPERRELRRLIQQLLADGSIERVGRSRFVLSRPAGGTTRGTLVGYGEDIHFHPEDGGAPLPVPQGYAGRALHGDEVEALPLRGEGRPAARVVRVIGRSSQVVLGSFRDSSGGGYVVPQDPRLPPRIYLAERPRGARSGDLVLVDVDWSSGDDGPPVGSARQSFTGDEPAFRFYRLLEEFGLPLAFPERVVREALELPTGNAAVERGRIDYRDRLVVTIDPVNAYDHDDAVSLETLGNGVVRLGIHIADVGAAVPPEGALDREARARGMSIYLEDGVVPMFPEELTRDVLSLVPDRDRLTLSVLVDLDASGRPIEFRTAPSVIRSARRLSYEEAEAMLGPEGEDAAAAPATGARGDDAGAEPVARTLREMWRLAGRLRRRREARGALDLDVGEAEVVPGPDGEPAEIRRRARLRSHRLIEEFMLLANEAVAKLLTRRGVPAIYRVHETPGDESMQELGDTLLALGYRLPAGERSRALLSVLRQARNAPERGLITGMVLRAMRKAVYSERNQGHFALATGEYTHFTSPIRRYADLTVHRALRTVWDDAPRDAAHAPEPWERGEAGSRGSRGGTAGSRVAAREGHEAGRVRRRRVDARSLAEIAAHVTRREIAGDQVERASFAEAAARYMRRHVGEEFEGIIGGFGRAGVFVQLADIPVEGLIPFSALGRERFSHLEGSVFLRGERSGRSFRLGDTVRVRVARADPEARHIDFELLAHDAHRGPAPSLRAHGARPVEGARRRSSRAGARSGGDGRAGSAAGKRRGGGARGAGAGAFGGRRAETSRRRKGRGGGRRTGGRR